MCESTVVMKRAGGKDVIMPEVARIIIDGNDIVLRDILGERKELGGVRLIEANLMDHEIILEEI